MRFLIQSIILNLLLLQTNAASINYDNNANFTKQTDVNGHVVEYAYDTLDRRITHTQGNASGNLITRYGYDTASNQISRTQFRDQQNLVSMAAIGKVKRAKIKLAPP